MQTSETYSIGEQPAPLPAMAEGLRAELRSLLDNLTGDNYREQLGEMQRVIRLWLVAEAWRNDFKPEVDDGNHVQQ